MVTNPILKIYTDRIHKLKRKNLWEVYESLPQAKRLSTATCELFRRDWAGGETDWDLDVWIEGLKDWLMNGSGFFPGYNSLSPQDKAAFDALMSAGQKLQIEIEVLENL